MLILIRIRGSAKYQINVWADMLSHTNYHNESFRGSSIILYIEPELNKLINKQRQLL